MPEWEEDWSTAWVIYVAAAFWVLPVLPQWVPLLVVGIAWLSGPAAYLRHAIRSRMAPAAVISVLLQLGLTGLCLLAFFGMLRLTVAHLLVVAALAAMAVSAMMLTERTRSEPRPRYGFEGLVMVCFSGAYLLATRSVSPVGPLLALLMLHTGILGVAVLRNASVEAQRVEGPVLTGGYAETAWGVRTRRPSGIRAVTAAMALPSGILGSALVLLELGLAVTFGLS
jgi:hypothetical protein